jgi:iron(III) transport system substrate-binding protein
VAYDPTVTTADELPRTWAELALPNLAPHVALANPLFGTTRGHAAAMLALWGPQRFRTFLSGLADGHAFLADGNSAAVRKLIAGDVTWALTDSDDVFVARRKGHRLEMCFPDMGDGGTLLIPNTVALLAGAPHARQAMKLIDFILSTDVEEMLARSDSQNYPVRPQLREKLGAPLPPHSSVTYEQIADAMPAAVAACREILLK